MSTCDDFLQGVRTRSWVPHGLASARGCAYVHLRCVGAPRGRRPKPTSAAPPHEKGEPRLYAGVRRRNDAMRFSAHLYVVIHAEDDLVEVDDARNDEVDAFAGRIVMAVRWIRPDDA